MSGASNLTRQKFFIVRAKKHVIHVRVLVPRTRWTALCPSTGVTQPCSPRPEIREFGVCGNSTPLPSTR